MQRYVRHLVIVLIVTLVAIPAPPSLAASRARSSADSAQHCVVWLEPIGPGQAPDSISADEIDLGCYATFDEAVAIGSAGATDLPEDTTPAELSDALLRISTESDGDGMEAGVLLGTEYDETQHQGASRSYYASSGCQNNTWEVASIGSTWNDRFESGQGFGACNTNRKFKHANFGGDSKLCTPNCNGYGAALNNEISSLRWKS